MRRRSTCVLHPTRRKRGTPLQSDSLVHRSPHRTLNDRRGFIFRIQRLRARQCALDDCCRLRLLGRLVLRKCRGQLRLLFGGQVGERLLQVGWREPSCTALVRPVDAAAPISIDGSRARNRPTREGRGGRGRDCERERVRAASGLCELNVMNRRPQTHMC